MFKRSDLLNMKNRYITNDKELMILKNDILKELSVEELYYIIKDTSIKESFFLNNYLINNDNYKGMIPLILDYTTLSNNYNVYQKSNASIYYFDLSFNSIKDNYKYIVENIEDIRIIIHSIYISEITYKDLYSNIYKVNDIIDNDLMEYPIRLKSEKEEIKKIKRDKNIIENKLKELNSLILLSSISDNLLEDLKSLEEINQNKLIQYQEKILNIEENSNNYIGDLKLKSKKIKDYIKVLDIIKQKDLKNKSILDEVKELLNVRYISEFKSNNKELYLNMFNHDYNKNRYVN